MAEHSLIRWLIFLIVVALVIGNKRIKPRKPPTHPLPVTGPVETSRISTSEEKDRGLQALARIRFLCRL
jgi:hypothetical protein